MNKQILIFTDMDGSLLDHFSYSHAPADNLLEVLRKQNIPVIPCTSKTQNELELLRRSLQNNHPFIVENGAAIFIPENYFDHQPEDTITENGYWVKKFAKERNYYQSLIEQIAPQFEGKFVTFAECSTEQIAEMTGLSQTDAALASKRSFGEPIAWHGREEKKKAFIGELTILGAQILEGGRFLHVSGDCDKGKALQWLTDNYQHQLNIQAYTIGVGDSGNDIAMLEAADSAVIIRSPVHDPPKVHNSDKYQTTDIGPEGWVEGVKHFLHKPQTSKS